MSDVNDKPNPQQSDSVTVEGLVSARTREPLCEFRIRGERWQMSMAAARSFAMDILNTCSRAEADAILIQFMQKHDVPTGGIAELMTDFRRLRHSLDSEQVEKSVSTPSYDPKPN